MHEDGQDFSEEDTLGQRDLKSKVTSIRTSWIHLECYLNFPLNRRRITHGTRVIREAFEANRPLNPLHGTECLHAILWLCCVRDQWP